MVLFHSWKLHLKLSVDLFPLSSSTCVPSSLSALPPGLDVGRKASCWIIWAIVQRRVTEPRCRRDPRRSSQNSQQLSELPETTLLLWPAKSQSLATPTFELSELDQKLPEWQFVAIWAYLNNSHKSGLGEARHGAVSIAPPGTGASPSSTQDGFQSLQELDTRSHLQQ